MTNLREEIENYIGSKPNIEGIHTDEILKLFEKKIDEEIKILDNTNAIEFYAKLNVLKKLKEEKEKGE